jgi:hypothetical protein
MPLEKSKDVFCRMRDRFDQSSPVTLRKRNLPLGRRICLGRDINCTADCRGPVRMHLQRVPESTVGRDPLSQRFKIYDRRQFRSVVGDVHKRLYSTPAFYSYVWSIVKRLSAKDKSKCADDTPESQMVFRYQAHISLRTGLVPAALGARHKSGKTSLRRGFAHRLSWQV